MFISDPEIKKSIDYCQHHLHNPFEIEQLLNWLVSGDFSEAELLYNFHNSMSTEKIKLPDDYYTNLKKSFENSDCWRRFKTEHLCRSKTDQGLLLT